MRCAFLATSVGALGRAYGGRNRLLLTGGCLLAVGAIFALAILILFPRLAWAAATEIEDIDCSPVSMMCGDTFDSTSEIDMASRIQPIGPSYNLSVRAEDSSIVSASWNQTKKVIELTARSSAKKIGTTDVIVTDRATQKEFRIPVTVNAPVIVGPSSISISQGETMRPHEMFKFSPSSYMSSGRKCDYYLSIQCDTSIVDPKIEWITGAYRKNTGILQGVKKGNASLTVGLLLGGPGGAASKEVPVTVKPTELLLTWKGKQQYTCDLDWEYWLEDALSVHQILSDDAKSFSIDNYSEYTWTSSNASVAKVTSTRKGSSESSLCLAQDVLIKTGKQGTAVITAKANNGNSVSFTVTVKPINASISLPSVQSWAGSNRVYLDFQIKASHPEHVEKVQVWRSTKKSGKYKLVKTVKLKYKGERYSRWIDNADYLDKKLKSNKAYYYKVRALTHGSSKYGAFSKPVKYWTAPSAKVKLLSGKSGLVKWKKVKGAKYYLVTDEAWISTRSHVYTNNRHWYYSSGGVNDVRSRVVKGTKWKMSNYDKKEGYKVSGIIPIAKHGQYYYGDGLEVYKSLAKYRKRGEF